MTALLVLGVATAGLVVGALWGLYGTLRPRLEGVLIALAGGALLFAASLDLIAPAADDANVVAAAAAVMAGAATFCAVDYAVDVRWGPAAGAGLLVAIVTDGIPENLALGVALIGRTPAQVAALTGSILLSNLPEAAGGARDMVDDERSRTGALVMWVCTAGVLLLAGLAGYHLMEGASESTTALLEAFAGGAVVASLATEVFPEAYRDSTYSAGLATAFGVVLALVLDRL